MDAWVAHQAARIATRAGDDLRRLVDVSSPSGDRHACERTLAALEPLLPDQAVIERTCSSTVGAAADLIATVTGRGRGRLLLLGHIDTVISHRDHRPLASDGDRLCGPGTYDMKGGLVLAAGVMRALAERRELFDRLSLLVTCDEEDRAGPLHSAARFAQFDACLCFEGGEVAGDGHGVVVRRKGAATLTVQASGLPSHAGAAPDEARSALAALAGLVAPLTQAGRRG